MQNFTNVPPQNSQFPNLRSGSAFTSPEQQRPVQYTQLQGATQPNLYQQRGSGFTSPSQGGGVAYPFYRQEQGSIPVQPVHYLSRREMIPGQPGLVFSEMARPGAIELTSTYAENYPQRVATNVSIPLIQLSPQIYQLVAQSNTQTTNGAFKVQEEMGEDLKNIIEKNFIENSKRGLAEFFNDRDKLPQEITVQISILASSVQTQYDSLKNPSRLTSQVARSFSSPEPTRPNGTYAKANNYLKLRLNAVIESLSQIESEQTYDEIKQCLSRLLDVNKEINLDKKHNDLLDLNFEESRLSSTLSSPASLSVSLQQKENRDLATQRQQQDSTRRIDELERQNQETLTMFNAGQNLWLAESRKLKEATQQIENLTKLKDQDERKIYELTTILSSYQGKLTRIHLLAQQEIEIESAKVDIAKLESQKQELESQFTEASQTNQSEKDQLNQRLQEKQSEIENHQRKINELQYLTATGKKGIELMNREISEIQELISQNLAEFESDSSKYVDSTNRIISEGMLRDFDNGESIQDLQKQLHEITEAYEEFRNFSNELNKTQIDKESTILRLQTLLGSSQREVRGLSERLISASELMEIKDKELAISENARKNLTGEKAVEDWLPPSKLKQKELTHESIEGFSNWVSSILSFTKSEQGTQTTDLPTLQLSESIEAIAAGEIPSALFAVELLNEIKYYHGNSVPRQQDSLQTVSLQPASSQRPSSPGLAEEQPAFSQQPSSPSVSPQPDQGLLRLRTEMQVTNSLMPTT
jgi:hypothetical protein